MNTQPNEVEVLHTNAVESITRGEIDIAIRTARAFPRQPAVVKSKMMSYACLDEDTASSCFYSLPRGGKNIQGPSVRLAEIAVSCYQNLRVGTRIIETVTTGDNPHVVVQSVAFDLENNVSVTIEKRRRIVGKKMAGGGHYPPSEDDINLASNAASAIAFRDATWKIVPFALVKPVYEQCRKVAVGDAKSLVDRRGKCLETFAKMGVSQERVLVRLDKKKVEEITLDDIETLIGIHTTIKEGEEAIEAIFPILTGTAAKSTAPTPPAPVKTAATPPAAASSKSAETPKAETAAPSTPVTAETLPEASQATAQATNEPVKEPEPANNAGSIPTQAPAPAPTGSPLEICRAKIASLDIPEKQLIRYLQALKPPMARGTQNSLDLLADSKLANIAGQLDSDKVIEAIKGTAV